MMVNPENSLEIGGSFYQTMLDDVKFRAPEEACGILAGHNNHANHVYVLTNELHSQVAYRMHPQEQISAFLDMESQGLEMLAIYHSHPTGPEVPSDTDLAEFAYPGVYSLIWFPRGDTWDCRVYLITKRSYIEIDWLLIEGE